MLFDTSQAAGRRPRTVSSLRHLAAASLTLCLCGSLSLRAGSIFDDDYVPPSAHKTAQAPSATAPSTPTAPGPTTDPRPGTALPSRLPVPSKGDQAKARQLFKEAYAKELSDRSVVARATLAKRLLAESTTSKYLGTDQFVLLFGAADAAREGGDLDTCFAAADALSEAYEIDGLTLKADLATKATLRAATPADTEQNCRTALALVDRLTTADDYASAAQLLAALRVAAAGEAALSRQVATRLQDVQAVRAAEPRMAALLAKLKSSPRDPAANFGVGQFYCLVKGDWPRGLPLLVRSGDPILRPLADADLAAADAPDKRVAAGDAWWTYAATATAVPKAHALARAAHRYELAAPGLSGLAKTRVDARLDEYAALVGGPAPATDLLATMRRDGVVRVAGGVVTLVGDSRITTPKTFKTPVTFQVVLQTDARDTRIGYAADQVIFNWEYDADELRIDGGPPDGKHQKGAGRLPTGRWVAVELAVTADELVIKVDGVERCRVKADFSLVDDPFYLRAFNGDVRVKSIEVLPGPAGPRK